MGGQPQRVAHVSRRGKRRRVAFLSLASSRAVPAGHTPARTPSGWDQPGRTCVTAPMATMPPVHATTWSCSQGGAAELSTHTLSLRAPAPASAAAAHRADPGSPRIAAAAQLLTTPPGYLRATYRPSCFAPARPGVCTVQGRVSHQTVAASAQGPRGLLLRSHPQAAAVAGLPPWLPGGRSTLSPLHSHPQCVSNPSLALSAGRQAARPARLAAPPPCLQAAGHEAGWDAGAQQQQQHQQQRQRRRRRRRRQRQRQRQRPQDAEQQSGAGPGGGWNTCRPDGRNDGGPSIQEGLGDALPHYSSCACDHRNAALKRHGSAAAGRAGRVGEPSVGQVAAAAAAAEGQGPRPGLSCF